MINLFLHDKLDLVLLCAVLFTSSKLYSCYKNDLSDFNYFMDDLKYKLKNCDYPRGDDGDTQAMLDMVEATSKAYSLNSKFEILISISSITLITYISAIIYNYLHGTGG